MSNYHFKTLEEANRVDELYQKVMKGDLEDINDISPHHLVKVTTAPMTPFMGSSIGGKFAVVSSDFKDIFYAGFAFKFKDPDENGVGWVVEEIKTISKYREEVNSGGDVNLVYYQHDD